MGGTNMALYFVTRENIDLNALPVATKVVWNDGPSAEFDAWRSSVASEIFWMSTHPSEVALAVELGVADVFATNSLAAATQVAANVAGGSLFDESGTLISTTPPADDAPDAPDGGGSDIPDTPGAHEDFVLITRKDLGADEINDLSGAVIGTLGNLTAASLSAYFHANGLEFTHLPFKDIGEISQAYEAGRVDAIAWPSSADPARLVSLLSDPSDHTILTVDGDGQIVPDYVVTTALLYEAGLGRQADDTGLNFWIDQHESGLDFNAMAGMFLDSSEFTSRFGDDDAMGNAEFVNVMYLNVLDRPGEQAGQKFWVEAMDAGLSREAVLIEFARSQENMEASNVTLHETRAGYWDFV